jgi:hypothetical protein
MLQSVRGTKLLPVVCASALIQMALLALPDTMGDLLNYRLWARALAEGGLAEAYWPSQPVSASAERLSAPIDYPPVVPYLLLGVGWVDRAFALSNAALDALIRLPLVLAALALGVLLFADLRRRGDDRTAVVAATLFLLNPGVLFDTACWGQADVLVSLFLVAALVLLGRGRPEWAWTSYAVAVLTKPLAYPFAPLLLLMTLKRFGRGRTLSSLGAFVAAALVLLLPFAAAGRLGPLVRSLFLQLDAMPYASVNAHNLWWLVERGTPWIPTRTKILGGPLDYEGAGLLLLAVFYLATLLLFWRTESEKGLRLGVASAAFGFFMLATHMHENHLFAAIPLLLLVGIEDALVRRFVLVLSAVFLVNMLLHDPWLTHLLRPLAPGPRLLLPQQRGLDPGFFAYFEAQGYPHLADQIRGETSLVGVVLTALNAQAAVVAFAFWLFAFYGRRSFDRALAEPQTRPSAGAAIPAVVLFAAVSGALFLLRAIREDTSSRAVSAPALALRSRSEARIEGLQARDVAVEAEALAGRARGRLAQAET